MILCPDDGVIIVPGNSFVLTLDFGRPGPFFGAAGAAADFTRDRVAFFAGVFFLGTGDFFFAAEVLPDFTRERVAVFGTVVFRFFAILRSCL